VLSEYLIFQKQLTEFLKYSPSQFLIGFCLYVFQLTVFMLIGNFLDQRKNNPTKKNEVCDDACADEVFDILKGFAEREASSVVIFFITSSHSEEIQKLDEKFRNEYRDKVKNAIQGTIRKMDMLFCNEGLGGFVVIGVMSIENAETLIKRIKKRFTELIAKQVLVDSLEVGAATYPYEGENLHSLIELAKARSK
ncbi:MAG: hypothetical protein ACRCWQ_08780, partial [Bacilli bacterium]